MKKNLVPRVRFKGFDDNWEQGNIGEVFELTRVWGFISTQN
ncbi:hypothetical protein NW733_01840 [Mycoplasmopsis felis]|nr:hypothetical protein [Mycoplasmopsis felis]MCU9931463.1 hypothetical protein [Mycoplasmopsis felis]